MEKLSKFKINRTKIIPSLGILIATTIWGSTFIITKNSLNILNPFVLLAFRFGLAALGMAIILIINRVRLFTHYIRGFFLGFIIWVSFVLQTVGLIYTSASNAGFISATFIIFIPIISYFVFKKRTSKNQIIAMIVAILGSWFITGGLTKMNFGDMLNFINAFLFAFYILIADKLLKENNNPLLLNFQQFFVVAVFSIICIIVFQLPFSFGNNQTIVSIFYLAIMATIVATGIQLTSQKYLDPFLTSILLSTESVFAAIFSWTFGHETFAITQALGGILIFTAAVISQLPNKVTK